MWMKLTVSHDALPRNRSLLHVLMLVLCVSCPPIVSAASNDARGGSGPSGTVDRPQQNYAVPIDLPSCESAPDVRHIRTVTDFRDVNQPEYRIFCVHPGDYSAAGVVTLTTDGTAAEPRWIRWHDPDTPSDTTTHPAKMNAERRATIRQLILGDSRTGDPANHWIIDRLTVSGFTDGGNALEADSSDNILNRLLIEDGQKTFVTFRRGRDNVLQYGVLRNARPVPHTDTSLVYLSESGHTSILYNEMYNATGSVIQQGPLSVSDHVIAGNEMYATPDYYTDCRGNRRRDGLCSCTEMGFVAKGAAFSDRWLRFENNVLFGFRPTDATCGGTGSSGAAVDLGSGGNLVRNILMTGNVIFDSALGIYLGEKVDHVVVTDNVLYGITQLTAAPGTLPGSGVSFTYASDLVFRFNTIAATNISLRGASPSARRQDIQCNAILGDSQRKITHYWSNDSVVDHNYFFAAAPFYSLKPQGTRTFTTLEESATADLCLTTRRHTGPEVKCLPKVVMTETSPHYRCLPR